MCIFKGILCDKMLSRAQFDSMTELQSTQIHDQAVVIAEKDSIIFNLKRDLEMQREQHDREVERLKERIEELDWRRIREIYPAEKESDVLSR